MAEKDDVYIGRRLLDAGCVGRESLIECLFEIALERRRSATGTPLGVLLVRRGLTNAGEIGSLLAERVRAPEADPTPPQQSDLALGELLVAVGATSSGQVNECLRLQSEMKAQGEPLRRLGELLVEQGIVTSGQIQRVLAYQDKHIHLCARCGTSFNVLGARPECTYRCPRCGGDLAVSTEGSVTVAGSTPAEAASGARPEPEMSAVPVAATSMPVLPPDAQAHIDRATKLYLRQKLNVRRSILNEAERFQLELSRYGLWVSFVDVVRRFGGLTWQQAENVRKTDFEAIMRSEAWKRQTVPGYRVLQRIACGGFGTIFSAEQLFGGRRVALKVMHADQALDPSKLAAFRQEAALMMKLDHRNIVRGFDFCDEGWLQVLVMELVEGDSLERLILESGALPAPKALSLARQIAEALRYMQTEGYIHRDVKPQNILVSHEGCAKLCDLGLAMEMRPGMTGRCAFTAGTPGYMSPEQARGEADLKVGTDIYALGGTLYFMLTGRKPFPEATSAEIPAEGERKETWPDMRMLDVSDSVFELLRRMTHPQREMRFKTYPELLAVMERA
ncbi:MAG: protein kinase [Planctomycetes bacterium]|nr:protein kinase [Planctomycetota bacterium]